MKRLIFAIIPALTLFATLLFSACAPAPYMIATLTQLPFARTPHTPTPYPTFTPRPTGTFTPRAEATTVEGIGTEGTGTAVPTEPALDGTVAAVLTLAAAPTGTEPPPSVCPPFSYDVTVPNPDTPEQYIGRHYDHLHPPQGMKWLASGLLSTENWSWTHMQVQGRDMYWIEKMVCRDSAGQVYWSIADSLTLPVLDPKKHEVIVDQCFNGDQAVPQTIGYGTYDPSKPAAPVVKQFVGWPVQLKGAWEMKDKFTPLDTQGLTCVFQEMQNNQ